MKDVTKLGLKIFLAGLIAFMTFSSLLFLTSINGGQGIVSRLLKCDDLVAHQGSIYSLRLVQERNGYTKLIVGDSVGAGILNSLQGINDEYCLASSNRGLTMKGYYYLLELFYETHPKMTDVYVIIRPQTMRVAINTQDSYTCLIMPLYQTGNIDLIQDCDRIEINELFGETFVSGLGAKLVNWSALSRKIYLNKLYEHKPMTTGVRECFSPMALDTILEMRQFCKDKNINLHFISAPLILEDGEYDFSRGDELAEKYHIEDIWEQMKETITYYPRECFRDAIHLSAEFLEENRDLVIEGWVEKSSELEDFVY